MTRRKLERDRLGTLALARADCGTFGAARNSVDTGGVVAESVVALDISALGRGDGQRADGESVFATRDGWA